MRFVQQRRLGFDGADLGGLRAAGARCRGGALAGEVGFGAGVEPFGEEGLVLKPCGQGDDGLLDVGAARCPGVRSGPSSSTSREKSRPVGDSLALVVGWAAIVGRRSRGSQQPVGSLVASGGFRNPARRGLPRSRLRTAVASGPVQERGRVRKASGVIETVQAGCPQRRVRRRGRGRRDAPDVTMEPKKGTALGMLVTLPTTL